jgi:hypothetical protein
MFDKRTSGYQNHSIEKYVRLSRFSGYRCLTVVVIVIMIIIVPMVIIVIVLIDIMVIIVIMLIIVNIVTTLPVHKYMFG